MSIPVAGNLDLKGKYQLQGALIETLVSDPTTPLGGRFWMRSGVIYYYDGSAVQALSTSGGTLTGLTSPSAGLTISGTTALTITLNPASGTVAGSMSTAHYLLLAGATSANTPSALVARDANGDFSARNITATSFIGSLTGSASQLNGQAAAYYLNFANTTGTRDHSAISDFDTQVRLSRLDQMATPTAAVAMGGQRITGLADPVNPQDAATMAWVDARIQGLDPKDSVAVATTANGALATAFAAGQVVDGKTLVAGWRILIKNQTAPAENGIYVVNASGAPTRSTDFNAWTEMPGAFVFVEAGGTTNGNTGWVCSVASGGTIGTTAITFSQFSGAGSYTASSLGTGSAVFAQMSGTVFQFRSLVAGSTKISLTQNTNDITLNVVEANLTLGNLGGTLPVSKGGTGATTLTGFLKGNGTGAFTAVTSINLASDVGTSVLPIANGGTGGATAAAALAALGAVHQFATTIGDGTTTTFAVNHALNTTDLMVQCWELTGSKRQIPLVEIQLTDANNLSVIFGEGDAPAANSVRVVVQAK